MVFFKRKPSYYKLVLRDIFIEDLFRNRVMTLAGVDGKDIIYLFKLCSSHGYITVAAIISGESLHIALRNFIGKDANSSFDKIGAHKCIPNGAMDSCGIATNFLERIDN